jgi:hypothetical protein
MPSILRPQGEEPRNSRRLEPRFVVVAALLLLLTGCHGGTLDSVYPGELGHRPPPAMNLPPQDQGMEQL